LGLSTVYGIVNQSGGAIETYSEAGQGTTFKIYLPGSTGAAPDVPETSAPSPSRQACESILVVEDDETVRTLVVAMLTALGYTVLRADSPDDALRLCADPAVRIDLLLTDMVLPHTDGTAIAQQAALHRPTLKVLFMSGYTEHAVLRRHALNQHTAFLQKPFTQSMLANKVRETLDARAETGAAGG
jgi:CheY-like chemotaxis protein